MVLNILNGLGERNDSLNGPDDKSEARRLVGMQKVVRNEKNEKPLEIEKIKTNERKKL